MKYTIKRPTSVGLLSRGRNYSVKDLGTSPAGYTDLLKKELGVSCDGGAGQTRWTQLHELFHVNHSLWSPALIQRRMAKVGRKLSVGSILAAEDARINEMGLRAISDAHVGFVLTMAPEETRCDIQGYAACHASPPVLADVIRPACEPEDVMEVDKFLAGVMGMPTRELTVLRVTVPLAEMLDRMMGEPALKGKPQPVPAESDEDTFGEPDEHSGTPCGGTHRGGDDADGRNPWVIPMVVEPSLTVPLRGGSHRVVTTETGSSIRWSQLHRIQTDGVIFRHAKRRPGALQRGTVLIDVSGSMQLKDDVIDDLIDALPYATVAVYSGSGSGNVAWVTVVARNGRKVASLEDRGLVPRGGSNTCDGPALLWLSRQPGPRLWVCDGHVTGAGDTGAPWMVDECRAIMQAAGIVQIVKPYGTRQAVIASRALTVGTMRELDVKADLIHVLRQIESGRV